MNNLSIIYRKKHINYIMKWVIISSIPGILLQSYFLGIGVICQIVLGIITAIISEVFALYLRKLSILTELKNYTAIITGLLLAINIPPLSPWWLVVIGTSFAILVVKHTYGGFGQNIFNPAMTGYLILLISFPLHTTYYYYTIDYNLLDYTKNFFNDLKIIFYGNQNMQTLLMQHNFYLSGLNKLINLNMFEVKKLIIFITEILRRIEIYNFLICNKWKLINLAYCFGGIIMIYRKIISWHIPIAYLFTLILCSLVSWLIEPVHYPSPLIHVFLGQTMLGIFFIATDPVTSPITKNGSLIYGIIIGLLTWIIRVYCGYYDGIVFAILLGNLIVSLIDYHTQFKITIDK
uniref:Ion-translocating oxidoreductase complex subunit D n=1 Tax=Candidatus Aschnera chinzeii TaxID=1485666 RepID=A0AAT9G4P7_9ENTR|nr:MAG: electron transport complex subunit RsxD [Candidatus Aschnera chinzeii]